MRFFILSLLLLPTVSWSFDPVSATVIKVIDGDTFTIQNGEIVRLIGINTPERARKKGGRMAPAEPFAEEATGYLNALIAGKALHLTFENRQKDRFGRLLAHAYLPDGTWVNAAILKAGMGHLYSFPDNREKIRLLELFTTTARTDQRGMWALPRWQVLAAEAPLKEENVGRFHLVEGKVRNVAKVKERLYLNFGDDWRTDFTVEIPPESQPYFADSFSNLTSFYQNRRILVRGVIKPVNGWLITVSHPEQLTIMN